MEKKKQKKKRETGEIFLKGLVGVANRKEKKQKKTGFN
jgi:hypothetical protein